MAQALLDSIALEAKMLSGWSQSAIPRFHAQQDILADQSALQEPILSPQGLDLTLQDIGCVPIAPHQGYTAEQKTALLNHIEKRWGRSQILVPMTAYMPLGLYQQGFQGPQIQFEVRVIPAHLAQRNFDVLFTVGLGAYPMCVPYDTKAGRQVELERIELVMRLPALYPADQVRDIQDHSTQGGWPWLLLRSLAMNVLYSHQYYGQNLLTSQLPIPYLSFWQCFKASVALEAWQVLAGCILIEADDFSVQSLVCRMPRTSHHLIRLLGVYPLFASELDFLDAVNTQGKNAGRFLMRKLQNNKMLPWIASLERQLLTWG